MKCLHLWILKRSFLLPTIRHVKDFQESYADMKNLVLQGERQYRLPHNTYAESSCIVDLCHCHMPVHLDGVATVLMTGDGLLFRVGEDGPGWTKDLNLTCGQPQAWSQVSFVAPNIVCLGRNGAIVTVEPESGAMELVGEFEHGIECSAWSPDKEILALVTLTEGEDGTLQSVLLSMSSAFEVVAEVQIENHDHEVSICWRPDSALLAISSVDRSDNERKVRIYRRENLELLNIGRTEDGSGKLAPNLQSCDMAWAGPGCSQLLATVQRKGTKTQMVAFFEPNGLRHGEFVLRVSPACNVAGLVWNSKSDIMALWLEDADSDKIQLWSRTNYHWYLKQELRFSKGGLIKVIFDEETPYVMYAVRRDKQPFWTRFEFRWETQVLMDGCSSTVYVVDGCVLNRTPLHQALTPPPMYGSSVTMDNPISHLFFSRATAHSSPLVACFLADGSCCIVRDRLDKGVPFTKSAVLAPVVEWNRTTIDPKSLRHFVPIGERNDELHLAAIASALSGETVELFVHMSVSLRNESTSTLDLIDMIPLEGRVIAVAPWLDREDGGLIQLETGKLLEYFVGNEFSITISESLAEPLIEPCPWIAGLKDMDRWTHGSTTTKQRLVIGSSIRMRLYCHDLLLCNRITSFSVSVSHEYLCYISAGSKTCIRFVPLVDLIKFDPLMGFDDNQLFEGYGSRAVERGSEVVTVVPDNPSVVLVLPRGNLEVVYPRALVLRKLVHLIFQDNFGEALLLMRRQQVDLNLLVDLRPCAFLADNTGLVKAFLEQTKDIDHLNLFIASLQNFDCTVHKLKILAWWMTGASVDNAKPFDFTGKVSDVCMKLRANMMLAESEGRIGDRSIEPGHFLLPILSTFAKEDPPKLDEALRLIKQRTLSPHTGSSSNKPPSLGGSSQRAIQYLAFLADYDLLFDTALGMYEFDLARAIASNSQMDPKVYLPLLRSYQNTPHYYGRFKVDLKLNRFDLALRNLVESYASVEVLEVVNGDDSATSESWTNDMASCLRFITEHELYETGLELLPNNPERSSLLLSLGDYLMNRNQASGALTAYMACENIDRERAMKAARLSGNWETLFILFVDETSNIPEESQRLKRQLLAREIAEELCFAGEGSTMRRRVFANAARILLDYGGNWSGAVDILLQGEMWMEAQRIIMLFPGDNRLGDVVEAAISFAETSILDMQERTDTFKGGMSRYEKVLSLRKEAIVREAEIDGDETVTDNESIFSIASHASGRSAMSIASTGSSTSVSSVISARSKSTFSLSGGDDRNRHKSKYNPRGANGTSQIRKKKGKNRAKVLPGSEQELIGIVQELRSSCLDELQRDVVAETITFLARNGKLDLATELYYAHESYAKTIEESQASRIERSKREHALALEKERREGTITTSSISLGVEQELDSFACFPLPGDLHSLFHFIPRR